MAEDQMIKELRLQTAILRAAFRNELESLSAEIRADPLSAAILDVLQESGPLPSGDLRTKALARTGPGRGNSDRTVVRRLSTLEEKGIVRRLGSGPSVVVELTGLVA